MLFERATEKHKRMGKKEVVEETEELHFLCIPMCKTRATEVDRAVLARRKQSFVRTIHYSELWVFEQAKPGTWSSV